MTKPTKWHLRPANTQISLGIRPVWSESSLCAQLVAKDPIFLHADSEDSDQTGRMLGAHPFCWYFVGFLMRWLKYVLMLWAFPVYFRWTPWSGACWIFKKLLKADFDISCTRFGYSFGRQRQLLASISNILVHSAAVKYLWISPESVLHAEFER